MSSFIGKLLLFLFIIIIVISAGILFYIDQILDDECLNDMEEELDESEW